MKEIPQRFYWKKWATFTGLLLMSAVPAVTISYAFDMSLLQAGLVQAGVCIFGSVVASEEHASTSKQSKTRDINKSVKSERRMQSTLKALAKKANIPLPLLKVKEGHHLNASSVGFPKTPTIEITDGFFELNQKHLTSDTIKITLSHELSHIKNLDTLPKIIYTELAHGLTMHLRLAMVAVLVQPSLEFLSMPVPSLSFSFIAMPLIFGGTLFGFNILSKIFDQSIEYIADQGAVQLTQKPSAAGSSIAESRFHALRWGTIKIEKNHEVLLAYDEVVKRHYKNWCKEAEKKRPQERAEFYRQCLKNLTEDWYEDILEEQDPKGFFQKFIPEDHPSMKSRRKAIKDTYPESFVTSKPKKE